MISLGKGEEDQVGLAWQPQTTEAVYSILKYIAQIHSFKCKIEDPRGKSPPLIKQLGLAFKWMEQ